MSELEVYNGAMERACTGQPWLTESPWAAPDTLRAISVRAPAHLPLECLSHAVIDCTTDEGKRWRTAHTVSEEL